MRNPKLVLVRWVDSYSNDRWHFINEAKEWGAGTFEVKTVGWLIDESDKHILLAGGYSNNKSVNNLSHIPKVNIIKKIEIEWK